VRIKRRIEALQWLRLRADLDNKRKKLTRSIDNINAALIGYYERNNRTELTDPESGVRWQKRQGTTQVWNEDALKRLLQKRNIPEELVFHIVPKEVIDEKALFQLMQDEIISLADVESVSHLETHKPYIVAVGNAKTNNSSASE